MIGVIADDLTGASELGGIGVRHGLRAEVVLQGECIGNADLLCIDTDSRSRPAKEAARRAANAASKLRKAGALWIYKKVDSVLRGNVLAEVCAIQEALGLESTLLIPANPRFGRVIRDGHYFIKGKLIHQTDFARDPEYPRRSSNVLKMLGVNSGAAGVRVTRLADYRPTSGIVLGEVSSSANVQNWASHRSEELLLAGGAEFFEAALNASELVLNKRVSRKVPSAEFARHGRRELFVCGSTSDYTERFIAEARSNGTPVFSIIERSKKLFALMPAMLRGIADNALLAFKSHRRVILAIGRPVIERPEIARKLSEHLAKIAVRVIGQAGPDAVYAEGGATAAELVRRLGWRRMKVLRELAPGVTTLALPGCDRPLLTIKPGSYPGWPNRRD
jgi:uncharacterized protein YgbK (DUF1537 family)